MNKYAIELKEDKQLSFKPVYRFRLVGLEMFKIYIKINLANSFICLFKSPVGVSILFDRKLDESLQLCVDYKSLNNLTTKN